jgi:DNA polymerase IIIc chi subunit
MTTQTLPEAKRAWLISQMIDELNELLWNHYEDEFISFILEEKDPDYQSILSDLK